MNPQPFTMDHRLAAVLSLVWLVLPAPAQQPEPARRLAKGGDLDKIAWEHPFARARELAREQHRVLLVKPILGGSNLPDPQGVACGGKHDCEGSW